MTIERKKAQKPFLPEVIRFFERGWFAPFLLSIQPVLHLFAINVAELNFSEILRPLLVSLVFGCIVLALAYLFLRDGRRASFVTSLFLFFFFLFGDIAVWTSKTFVVGAVWANLATLALATVLMAIAIWLVQNRIKDIASANLYFNLLAVLLFINSGLRMGN